MKAAILIVNLYFAAKYDLLDSGVKISSRDLLTYCNKESLLVRGDNPVINIKDLKELI